MILSKHPIIHSGRIDFPGATGNMAMYSDLLINDLDTLRVYNVHLQSIRFRKTDYDFVSGNENGKKSNLEQGKGLLRRMLDAYGKRANQAEVMVEHIKTTPYPVMVCGDFNDVPLSYAYQTMSRNLLDAFREAGNGIERTYKGPFPSFRIDYILFSRKLACKAYHSSEQVPGDHKLVWAELEISSSAYRK
jgi:endonuclease/exonuclease/phosphatase family metal-dependent hydrolase